MGARNRSAWRRWYLSPSGSSGGRKFLNRRASPMPARSRRLERWLRRALISSRWATPSGTVLRQRRPYARPTGGLLACMLERHDADCVRPYVGGALSWRRLCPDLGAGRNIAARGSFTSRRPSHVGAASVAAASGRSAGGYGLWRLSARQFPLRSAGG